LTGEPRPSANVAVALAAIDAYNARDYAAFLANARPDVEWRVTREHPSATTHRGFDAIREYLDDWRATLQDIRLDVHSVAEAGDRVMTVCRVRGTGAESGADTTVEIAFLTTFHEGKAIRVEEFLDLDEAKRALGDS
jgi:ketosteroid isomerase-like protein